MLNLYDSLLALFYQDRKDTLAMKATFTQAEAYADFLKSYRIKSPALGVPNAWEATGLNPFYEYCKEVAGGTKDP